MALTKEFRAAVFAARARGERMYLMARMSGLSPAHFSNLLHGRYQVRDGDLRLVKVAHIIGFSGAVFAGPAQTDAAVASDARSAGCAAP